MKWRAFFFFEPDVPAGKRRGAYIRPSLSGRSACGSLGAVGAGLLEVLWRFQALHQVIPPGQRSQQVASWQYELGAPDHCGLVPTVGWAALAS